MPYYPKDVKSWDKKYSDRNPCGRYIFLQIFSGFYRYFGGVSGVTPRKVFKYATSEPIQRRFAARFKKVDF